MSKELIKQKENEILGLVVDFCKQKLNDEYYNLCEKLVKKLGRKRQPPFLTGKIEIWSAAIVHTIGSINFLFDKDSQPYVSASEIHDFFGTKSGTVSAKSSAIKKMLNMGYFDNEFSTQRMTDSNPLNNMVFVDGFIVPLSSLPQDVQELVKSARAEGKDIQLKTN